VSHDEERLATGQALFAYPGGRTWVARFERGRPSAIQPPIYEHPDNLPVRTSHLEARLGRRLAPAVNPQISLPGHFSIFDHLDWTQALAPAAPQLPEHSWATAQANQKRREATEASPDPGPPPF